MKILTPSSDFDFDVEMVKLGTELITGKYSQVPPEALQNHNFKGISLHLF